MKFYLSLAINPVTAAEQSPEQTGSELRPLEMMSDVQCQQAYQQLAQVQAGLSAAQLSEWHEQLQGPKGLFALLVRELEQSGRQACLLDDLQALANRAQRAQADRAVQFALGHHRQRHGVPNPYRSFSRERLGCMVYDESAGFALVERYSAYLALRQLDGQFFARLIDTTRKTVERRLVFRGLLEHFDRLLPIERSVYPADYRATQQSHLDQEQQLYGELQLAQPLCVLLEKYSAKTLLRQIAAGQAGNA